MSRTRIFTLAAAGALMLAAGTNPALADGDAAKGEAVFKKCQACHDVGDKNKVGPGLKGLFGRAAGTHGDFKYSDALKASGITWDEASLDKWLTNPKDLVKDTKMIFPGMKKEDERKDLIAYLKAATK